MSVKVEIYRDTDREVHMVGDNVGVCWRVESRKKTITGEDGLKYTADEIYRCGDPYINFVWIRKDDEGIFLWIDEDSVADCGFGTETAMLLIDELKLAVEYIKGDQP